MEGQCNAVGGSCRTIGKRSRLRQGVLAFIFLLPRSFFRKSPPAKKWSWTASEREVVCLAAGMECALISLAMICGGRRRQQSLVEIFMLAATFTCVQKGGSRDCRSESRTSRVFALQFFISWKEKVPKRKETGVGGQNGKSDEQKTAGERGDRKRYLPTFSRLSFLSQCLPNHINVLQLGFEIFRSPRA